MSDHPPTILNKVTITQKLNTGIPLDGEFRDETGKAVRLGDYFGKRPVILSLVYYQCKMLCPEEIDGLVGALEMVKFAPGKDFDVVFVSIDPSETPEIAAREKALYVKRYGRPETASGWHFLTGPAAGDQRPGERGRLRLRACAWAGRHDEPVCSCQRDRDPDPAGQAVAVLPRRGVLAERFAAGSGRGVSGQDWHAGGRDSDLLLSLRSDS